MWQVENETLFAADRGWVRDRGGAEIWIVVVKATFDIQPDGSTRVATDQPPVLRIPEYFGEPGKSSIKYPPDLVLTKKTTDIIVVGHAHAPLGHAVQRLDVGFRVGAIQKGLQVFGDRKWGKQGPTDPAPFTKMPLVYERAFGGVDTKSSHPERDWEWRNPIGCGFAVEKAHLDGTSVPNVESTDHQIMSWDDRPTPAGFGAIDCHWQPRASYAGTYDNDWLKNRQPLVPIDFDELFFQCAPADQQPTQFLTGGEAVTLLNLSPRGALRFSLPKPYIGFETHFYDGSVEVHKTRKLHSVILEPDFPRVSLVWHSALPCHFKVQKLDRTIVTLKTDIGTVEPAEDTTTFELA